MPSYLITGASGALGTALAARLRVIPNARVLGSRLRHGVHCGDDHICDIRKPEEVINLVKAAAPDVVYHLAATYEVDIDAAYAVNVIGARNVLDAIGVARPSARVVVIGSAAEYGVVRQNENPVREDRALAPVSVYGLTKAWQTQLASLYANRGVDVLVARLFNLDDPLVSDRLFVGRLARQISQVQSGERSTIEVGPLNAVRDYVTPAEACAQLMAITESGETGSVYHVASGVPVSMREMMTRHLQQQGLDARIVRESPAVPNRLGYDVPVIYADMTRTNLLRARGEAACRT